MKKLGDNRIQRIGGYIVAFFMLLFTCVLFPEQVKASGADVLITTGADQIQKGDEVYIIISVTSEVEMAGFEGSFSYDNRFLQFESGGSVVAGNDDHFTITDLERETFTKQIKYSIKFLAKKTGVTRVELIKPYHVFGSSFEDTLSVSHHPLSIEIQKKEKPTNTPAPQKTADSSPDLAATATTFSEPSATPLDEPDAKSPVLQEDDPSLSWKMSDVTETPQESEASPQNQKSKDDKEFFYVILAISIILILLISVLVIVYQMLKKMVSDLEDPDELAGDEPGDETDHKLDDESGDEQKNRTDTNKNK